MGSIADIAASVTCPDNHDIYREMVALELRSTFAFQGKRWLADVAPELLLSTEREIAAAKAAGAQREQLESRIPEHLLYTKGWPTVMPTDAEAEMLCEVRRGVGAVLGIAVKYIDPASLIGRFSELMAMKEAA